MAIKSLPTGIELVAPPASTVSVLRRSEVLEQPFGSANLAKQLLGGIPLHLLPTVRAIVEQESQGFTYTTDLAMLSIYWNNGRINEMSERLVSEYGVVGMQRVEDRQGRVIDCLCFTSTPQFPYYGKNETISILHGLREEDTALSELLCVPAGDIDQREPSQRLLDGEPILACGYEYIQTGKLLGPQQQKDDVIVVPLRPIEECGDDFRMALLSYMLARTMEFSMSQGEDV